MTDSIYVSAESFPQPVTVNSIISELAQFQSAKVVVKDVDFLARVCTKIRERHDAFKLEAMKIGRAHV